MTAQARDSGQFIMGFNHVSRRLHMVFNSLSISVIDNLCSMPNNLPVANVFSGNPETFTTVVRSTRFVGIGKGKAMTQESLGMHIALWCRTSSTTTKSYSHFTRTSGKWHTRSIKEKRFVTIGQVSGSEDVSILVEALESQLE